MTPTRTLPFSRLALTLFEVERVAGEHLLRADRSRQDLLGVGELDHRVDRLTIARQAIGPRLPHGVTVAFKLKMRNRLHARFILTDVGGVQFADGLDELRVALFQVLNSADELDDDLQKRFGGKRWAD